MGLIFLYILGVLIGLFSWSFIQIPMGDSYGIVSRLTVDRISPLTQMIRFFVLISLPAMLLFVWPIKKPVPLHEQVSSAPQGLFSLPTALLALLLMIACGLSTVTTHAGGEYDSFHEGEVLAAGVAADHHLIPYKDYRFVHGYFENPGKVQIAFDVFGQSVGAVRTVSSILQVCAYFFLGLLLLVLVGGRYEFTLPLALGLIVLGWEDLRFLPRLVLLPRDAVPLLWACGVLILVRSPRAWIAFGVGLLASLLLIVSVDRAYFCIFATLLLPFFISSENRSRSLLVSLCVGLGIGFYIVLLTFQGGIPEFIKYVFWTLPRTHDLNSGRVLSLGNIPFVVSTFLFSSGAFWLVYQWKTTKNFLYEYKQELLLFLLALLWFRSVLNRADEEHVSYNCFFLYLFWGSAFVRHIYADVKFSRVLHTGLQVAAGVVSVFLLVTTDYRKSFPSDIPDSEILPNEYEEFALKARSLLRPEDSLFVLGIDSTWYYIFDTPPPSGYTMAWFAATTEAQEGVVLKLQKQRVKYVLQRNGEEALDSVYLRDRLPVIFKYVESEYEEALSFKKYRILVRKDPFKSS